MNSGKVKSCGLDLESPKNDFSDGGEYRNAQMSNFWRSIWIISTEIQLKHIKCSSAHVLNSLIEQLVQLVDEEKGLKKLRIFWLCDQNNLEEWLLDQLVAKCFALEAIKIELL